jgi:hypothetical protein
MKARTPYIYEHLRVTEPAYLEIDEVITGASLLTGMSITTESIASVKSWNKSR